MASVEAASCCSPALQETCCEPEAKSECCGSGGNCGCDAGRSERPEKVREEMPEHHDEQAASAIIRARAPE